MERLRHMVRATGLRRTHVAAARLWLERNALAVRPRPAAPVRSRILCYHSVGTPSWGVNDVSPARFRRHLELARAEGWRFVPADEIARTGGRPGDLAITFDDGVASVAENAAPILAEAGVPFTIFVVSEWASGRGPGDGAILDWAGLAKLAARPGVTVGSHSRSHPRFAALAPQQIVDELASSREAIQERLGLPVSSFAIPYGQQRDWTPECQRRARDAGYAWVYAQAELTSPPGTVPRTFITRYDDDRTFKAALRGAFDRWEEWV